MAERRLDFDRQVALEQLPRKTRPAFSALWNLDLAFADVVSTSSDLRLGAVRLAWWRERLEELDSGMPTAGEPRMVAVASELLPHAITGRELSQLEDAWLPLLEPFPWGRLQAEGLRLRGRVLFGLGARLLGSATEVAERAGELWSLIDGAQHCSDPHSCNYLVDEAASLDLSGSAPVQLRPLTVVAALAVPNVRDPSSGLARGMAAARHRLTGRFPRL